MQNRLYEAFQTGRKAHNGGAHYADGGGYQIDSPEDIAWRAGWEIDCADQIEQGRESSRAWPIYPLLKLTS